MTDAMLQHRIAAWIDLYGPAIPVLLAAAAPWLS